MKVTLLLSLALQLLLICAVIGIPVRFPDETPAEGRAFSTGSSLNFEEPHFHQRTFRKKRRRCRGRSGGGRSAEQGRFFFPKVTIYDTDINVVNGNIPSQECNEVGLGGLLGGNGLTGLVGNRPQGANDPFSSIAGIGSGIASSITSGITSGLDSGLNFLNGGFTMGLSSFENLFETFLSLAQTFQMRPQGGQGGLGGLIGGGGGGGGGSGTSPVSPPISPPISPPVSPPITPPISPPISPIAPPPVTEIPVAPATTSPPNPSTGDGDNEDYDYTDFGSSSEGPSLRPIPGVRPNSPGNNRRPGAYFNRYVVRPINRTIKEFYSLL